MKFSDFSFKNCMYVENNKSAVVTEEKLDIPDTPLMSDDVFEFVKGEEGEDEDYSNVIDYFELSRIAVRADDENDYKDVYASTPGECAKICYDNDESIGDLDYECNAFQTDGRRKCRIFWSTSEFEDKRTTDDQIAFRIKIPRDRENHEKQKEKQKENTGQVYTYTSDNYNGLEKALPFQNYDRSGLSTGIKSIIVPSGYAVEIFTGETYSGTSTLLYGSQRVLPSPYHGNVQSIKIAQIGEGDSLSYHEDVYPEQYEVQQTEEDDDDYESYD